MLFSLIMGLYTSLAVLAVMGVEDYGVYGVIDSIVAMTGFLNRSEMAVGVA